MTLLDAYALVALIVDEPAGDEVEELLRAGDSGVVVANLAEAIDVSQRVYRLSAGEVRAAVEPLFLGGVSSAVASGESEAWQAAALRTKHYDRKNRALSLADCFLLAHAVDADAAIATADPPLAEAARSEGIEVIALPDPNGKRP